MMSADVKTSIKQQEIKDLVAHLANFYTRITWCIFHLILVGILCILILPVKNRRVGWFLLNLLGTTKVICRQSLSCVVPKPSTLPG